MAGLITGPLNVSGAGDKIVIAGIDGYSIQVIGLYFQCGVATTLTIKEGANNATGTMSFLASGGLNLPVASQTYFFCDSGEDFTFHFGGFGGSAGGQIFYYQDPI